MKRKHFIIILCLTAFHAINNYFWLLQNRLPVSYDEGIHLWTAMRFVRVFTNPQHNIFYDLFNADLTQWPPLFYVVAGLFNLILGPSYISSAMTNSAFLLLLFVSLYLIGERLHSLQAGLLSVLILSFYPIIYGHSRLFQIDLALTAIVTFSIYCLILSDRFKNLRWSIIYAISMGVGMLLKWSYIIFILPVLVYTISLVMIESCRNNSFRRTKNMLLSIIISVSLSLLWHITNMEKTRLVLTYFVHTFNVYYYQPGNWVSEFALNLNNYALSFLFFSLFLIATPIFYLRYRTNYKFLVTIWYLAPFLILGIFTWFQPRFFMPALPALALISGVSVSLIKKKIIRNLAVAAILVLALAQFFAVSFVGRLPDDKRDFLHYRFKGFNILYSNYLEPGCYDIVGAGPPHRHGWGHDAIAESIARNVDTLKSFPLTVGILYEEENKKLDSLFSNRVLSYFITQKLIDSEVIFSEDLTITLNKVSETWQFIEAIADMDVVVYISKGKDWPTEGDIKVIFKDEKQLISESGQYPFEDLRLIGLINSRDRFLLKDIIELQDGYQARIYFYRIPEIEKKGLSVKVFNGNIKLYYKDKEITKGEGLLCSIDYAGNTYTYKEALHSFDILTPNSIKLFSQWHEPGIKQTITLTIDPKRRDTVNIRCGLQVKDDIVLDHWYIECMVSDSYEEWSRPFMKGRFKKIGMFLKRGEVELVDEEYNGIDVVGVIARENRYLPALLFSAHKTDVPTGTRIYNKDYYHSSRSITTCTINKEALEAGVDSKNVLDLDIAIMDKERLENRIRIKEIENDLL
ncbi:MAG: glycosyltransferase family 39 protein [Candidatus Omnitrophica bacterium]|nr:glycosyltransferase family 39 protein [Candidatus Omnitrophota bacterium]MBU1933283.1 glycosyltransferase family 39 protein [Candidatus Omnitrophota bacterium]